jgi:dihydropteroate synthase
MDAEPAWTIPRGGRQVPLGRPLVMGILNINDDSFCGDGTLDPHQAAGRARAMLAAGADIIDIGAESARTNRGPISVAGEIARLEPLLAAWPGWLADWREARLDARQLWPPLLSLNTWRPEVAAAVLPLGGDLLNDIGALPDDRNARLCARHGTSLVVMHSFGSPKVPQRDRRWDDIHAELDRFFTAKLAMAEAAGVPREALVIDPGIDFAKQRDDNLAIYRHAGRLARFARPVLMPVSRKTVIGEVLGQPDPCDRDPGTLACLVATMAALPATIFRVHNVAAAADAIRVLAAVPPA